MNIEWEKFGGEPFGGEPFGGMHTLNIAVEVNTDFGRAASERIWKKRIPTDPFAVIGNGLGEAKNERE
jgi:hypothetical protein